MVKNKWVGGGFMERCLCSFSSWE